MVPAGLHDFFVASTGASAALLGLLFVAVSLQPERIFADPAAAPHRAAASGAFFALGNILFISLGALLPQLNLGLLVLVVGGSSAVNSLLVLMDTWPRGARQPGRTQLLTLGGLALYALQCHLGLALWRHPQATGALDGVTYALLVCYAIGFRRAWELLGGADYSLVRALGRLRWRGQGAARERPPEVEPDPPGSA